MIPLIPPTNFSCWIPLYLSMSIRISCLFPQILVIDKFVAWTKYNKITYPLFQQVQISVSVIIQPIWCQIRILRTISLPESVPLPRFAYYMQLFFMDKFCRGQLLNLIIFCLPNILYCLIPYITVSTYRCGQCC